MYDASYISVQHPCLLLVGLTNEINTWPCRNDYHNSLEHLPCIFRFSLGKWQAIDAPIGSELKWQCRTLEPIASYVGRWSPEHPTLQTVCWTGFRAANCSSEIFFLMNKIPVLLRIIGPYKDFHFFLIFFFSFFFPFFLIFFSFSSFFPLFFLSFLIFLFLFC